MVSRFVALTSLLGCIAATSPARAQIPSPESFLGHRVGADSLLASWRQIGDYFTRLAAASPKVRVDTLGLTTQGRPFLLVTISDPANLARRHDIMAAQRRLADPRRLAAGEDEQLAARQPAVILINCSIHSTEIAASQMSMELAWRLATDTALGRYLENVVVLLVPSANPDGIDIVGEWYRASRGTAWDGTGPPWLYHPYVGHDNNRDWFMLTQRETRLLTRVLYHQWFPLVFYDVHQMGAGGARFFVPPFADPVNPNLDASVVAGMNLVGATMASAVLDAGHGGVVHQQSYDLWWHGGARSTPTRHNMVGILSEAASARIASPNCASPTTVRQPTRGVNYPAPWHVQCWRLRDIVDYELLAAEALVKQASDQRSAFIRRFVNANRRAIAAGQRGPSAFVLPPTGDLARRAHLANLLLAGGVEVHRARAGFRAGGADYAAGTLVVPMAQPFRAHAKDLLERQQYPDRRAFAGGPQIPPYDVSGWTLGLQMDVATIAVDEPFGADLEALDTVTVAAGAVTGRGDVILLDNTWNAHIGAAWSALAAGASLQLAPQPFSAEGRLWPAGTLVVRGGRAAIEAHARTAGFTATAVRAAALPAGTPVVRGVPRVGLYQSWNGSMDEGWTRWVFEQLGVTYVTVHDSLLRAGNLATRFDVIILPSETEAAMHNGRRAGTVPAAYAGGLGEPGRAALRAFLDAGGTVIALDAASRYAINRLGAPASVIRTSRTAGADAEQVPEATADSGDVSRFYAPGSIFDVAVDRTHPVAAGMADRAAVYFINSTILEPGPGARVVASYPRDQPVLLSGYVDGAGVVAGRAALLDAPVGRGRAILFGFRPQHRGQTHGTFRLLTNAILYGAGR